MKILISYRASKNIRDWETGHLISKAFMALGHQVFEYANIYETADWIYNPKEILYNGPFDLHLFMEKNDPSNQYPELAGIRCNKSIAWLFDTAMQPAFYDYLIKRFNFDHVFCANPQYINNRSNYSWLPYAADEDLFFRSLDFPKTKEVAIIGSDRPERRILINALQSAGINAELISGIFKEKYIDALASSKIIVNDQAGGGRHLLPIRTFEAPMAGSVLMQIETQSLSQVFEPGISCVVYSNVLDLVKKCRLVLENNSLYENIRSNGQTMCKLLHTYKNRAKEILKCLNLN